MTGPNEQIPNEQNPDTTGKEGATADTGAALPTSAADPKPSSRKGTKGGDSKEDRLGAALRANLRRRKAQARGRKSGDDPA